MQSDQVVRQRRRFPRIEVDGTVRVRDVTAGIDRDVIDVSLGGFRSAGPVPLEPGANHTFEFSDTDLDVVVLKACVVHCYPVAEHDPASGFTIGWLWMDMPVNVDGVPVAVVTLIDYLTSIESLVDGVVPTRRVRPQRRPRTGHNSTGA